MNTNAKIIAFINASLFSVAGLVTFLLTNAKILSDRASFTIITLLLLTYLFIEISRFRRLYKQSWLLNPYVLCSMITFITGYGITNILFFMPAESIEFLGLVPDVTTGMVKLMFLVLIAAIGMSMGYVSIIATTSSSKRTMQRFQNKFLPKPDKLHVYSLPILVIISAGVRFYAIKLGMFGYSSSYDQLISAASYTQYIALASSLGGLALVLAALQYYGLEKKSRYATFWFYGVLALEIMFGFLSGFKSAVAMPFVILGVCQYLQTGKIPKNLAIMTLGAILIAYLVIEPFRVLRNQSMNELTSVSAIFDLFSDVVSGKGSITKSDSNESYSLAIASRSNMSYIGSFGIDYRDNFSELPEGSPAFLENIFLAPAHALIPRFLWKNKPLSDIGIWYNQVVIGSDGYSSTAMGSITYLYLAGGYIAVFLFFFVIGIFQRILFSLILYVNKPSAKVLFLAMLPTFAIIDTSVNSIVVNLFRLLPLILILMFFIFMRRNRTLPVVV